MTFCPVQIQKWVRTAPEIFILLSLFLVSLPFFLTTTDTGWVSDDYQYFLLFYTKVSLSSNPFSDLLSFRPGSGGHVAPFTNFLNYLFMTIHKDPRLIRFLIYIAYVLTGYFLYKIVTQTHNQQLIAWLSAIIFVSSYDLSIKSLVWLTFHYNTTNTLTGTLSIFFLIKYLQNGLPRHLSLSSICLLLTFLNYESGLVFLVVTIMFIVMKQFLPFEIPRYRLSFVFGSLIIVLSIYFLFASSISGSIAPVLTDRLLQTEPKSTAQTYANGLLPSSVSSIEESNETPNLKLDRSTTTPSIGRLRSTYAPRTALVASFRTIDLSADILNLSFIEKYIRYNFYSKIGTLEKKQLEAKYSSLIRKYSVLLVLLMALPIGYFAKTVYTTIKKPTKGFLYILFTTAACFIFIFNRIDIANSIALFSSVVIADLTISGSRNGKHIRQLISIAPLVILLLGSATNIFTDFKYIYPFEKTLMNNTNRITNLINKQIGEYHENVVVLVDIDSSYWHPAINELKYTDDIDLSHSNIAYFQDSFEKSNSFRKFGTLSIVEFMSQPELANNIKVKLVKGRPSRTTCPTTVDCLKLYLDHSDSVFRL